jgi:hypothetical protein
LAVFEAKLAAVRPYQAQNAVQGLPSDVEEDGQNQKERPREGPLAGDSHRHRESPQSPAMP